LTDKEKETADQFGFNQEEKSEDIGDILEDFFGSFF